jgi:putative DNA primase/helicase
MKDGEGNHRVELITINDLPTYSYEQIAREFPPADKPHRLPKSRAGLVILDPKDPVKTAYEWIRRKIMVEGAEEPFWCLHYYRHTFYRVGTHFQEVEEIWLRNQLYAFLSTCHLEHPKTGDILPFIPNETKVRDVIKALEAVVYLPDRFDDDEGPQAGERRNSPFWIDTRVSGDNLIACRNGLLDLETKTLTPHTPAFFNINTLPFAYDPGAPTPKRWIKFLRELWPGDEGKRSRMTLQEMFGLMLTADTSYEKIFLIIGPKRSGKGTIGRVLRRLIGIDNVARPTMASLGGEFGLWPLIDKQVAMISDARVPGQDAQKIAERLLSISGEDGVTTNRKYQSFWTGQLGVRFLIMTNKLPRIADASGALVSRYVVLTMTKSFYGREQKDLTDELYKEMAGILNWSIRGLERLRSRDGTDRQGFIIRSRRST